MKAWRAVWFLILTSCCQTYLAYNIGILTKKEDDGLKTIVEHVVRGEFNNNQKVSVYIETVDYEDPVSYHRALCQLESQGIVALLASGSELTNSILMGYSFESKTPFITISAADITSGVSSPFALGIRPSTTRAVLGLLQQKQWKDIVYIYDHEYGIENLHMMILLGHRVLKLNVDGLLKVTSDNQASVYLQTLDHSYGNKDFHVILDTDPVLAWNIIWRHLNDINIRKKNFDFLLTQPVNEKFMTSSSASFGPVCVTEFTVSPHLDGADFTVQAWIKNFTISLGMLPFYYYDTALVVNRILHLLATNHYRLKSNVSEEQKCFQENPHSHANSNLLQKIIPEINIRQGVVGNIKFENGLRTNIELNITEKSGSAHMQVGTWVDGVLQLGYSSERGDPTTLPLIQDAARVQITTRINPPYMMLREDTNSSYLKGNDRFKGYIKDILDFLTQEMEVEYELHLVEDNDYGKYDKLKGKWSGMIGEVISGKADVAAADLTITGQRQRVVEFTDPFDMVGFSLMMKNPLSIPVTSSLFFFISSFSSQVWICTLLAVVIFTVLFNFITMFTGVPDSIESASGIWGRKPALVLNIWFATGSSLIRETGVYPRSMASRMLSGVFWLFTIFLSALFIASTASQILMFKQMQANNPRLVQLKDLSLESLILESIAKGWPRVGLVNNSTTAIFVRKSSMPIFQKFAAYLRDNLDVTVTTDDEGLKRVHSSNGDYMIMQDSLITEYAIRQKPCDTIATHSVMNYAGYGFATRLGSQWTSKINNALVTIRRRGTLGNLHRKWWIDTSECKNVYVGSRPEMTIHIFSGLFIVILLGFLIISTSFGVQYIRKKQKNENRLQQLSFEDINLCQTFPVPPPELLSEPTPVLNLPEYERKTLL